MEYLSDRIIIALFYILWPAAIIIGIYIATKQKKKKSLSLMFKAIWAWLVMLILAVSPFIYYNQMLNDYWGTISIIPTILGMMYSLKGWVSLIENDTNRI